MFRSSLGSETQDPADANTLKQSSLRVIRLADIALKFEGWRASRVPVATQTCLMSRVSLQELVEGKLSLVVFEWLLFAKLCLCKMSLVLSTFDSTGLQMFNPKAAAAGQIDLPGLLSHKNLVWEPFENTCSMCRSLVVQSQTSPLHNICNR